MRIAVWLLILIAEFPLYADEKEEAIAYLSAVARTEVGGSNAAKVALPVGMENWKDAAWRLVVLGRKDIIAGNTASAEDYLQQVVLQYPTSAAGDYAKGYLGVLAEKKGLNGDAVQTLEPLISQIENPDIQAEFVFSFVAAAREVKPRKALELAGEYYHKVSGTAKERFRSAALDVIDRGFDFYELREIYEQPPTDFPFIDLLTIKLARVYLHIHEYESSKAMADKYLANLPNGDFAGEARAIESYLSALTATDPAKIGVLLPLSGEKSVYGKQALDSICLALGASIPTNEGSEAGESSKSDNLDGVVIESNGIKFIFRDTAADAVKTEAVLEDLVRRERVIAVLGPLFSAPAVAAAHKAEDLDVPLLTLTQKEGITLIGKNVFRNGLTSSRQAHFLADFVMNRMGMDKFAILAPEHPYGIEMAQLFWDSVEALGGEIVGYETYEQDATTFSDPVKRLVGRYYLSARPRIVNAKLMEQAQKKTGYRKTKAISAAIRDAPPVVDFDAIFIPDYYQTASLVAPAVAFEDVILYTESRYKMERIRKATGKYDLKMIRLLGASGWNSAKLMERGGEYVENAVFVDGFYPASQEKEVIEFVEAFRKTLKREPNIIDAQAYESAKLLLKIAGETKPKSRVEFRMALKNTKDFAGATGHISFDETGDVLKPLYVLTVYNGKIRLMEDILEEKERDKAEKESKGGQ